MFKIINSSANACSDPITNLSMFARLALTRSRCGVAADVRIEEVLRWLVVIQRQIAVAVHGVTAFDAEGIPEWNTIFAAYN